MDNLMRVQYIVQMKINLFVHVQVIISCGLWASGCQSLRPIANLKNREPFPPPYVECYRRDSAELCFLAADHQGGYGSTHLTIDKVWESFEPQLVILEGFATEKGKSPKYVSRRRRLCSDIHSKKCDEGSYAMVIAGRKDVTFIGGEPSEIQIKDGIIALGRSMNDLLGFYIVRQVPQWKRNGTLQLNDLPKRVDRFIQDYAKMFNERTDFNWIKFKKWFVLKTGRDFVADTITTEDPAPFSGPGTTEVNAISRDVGEIRDAHLMTEITKQ